MMDKELGRPGTCAGLTIKRLWALFLIWKAGIRGQDCAGDRCFQVPGVKKKKEKKPRTPEPEGTVKDGLVIPATALDPYLPLSLY